MNNNEQAKIRLPGTNSREAHPVEALNFVQAISNKEDSPNPITQQALAQLEKQNHIVPEARITLRKAA